MAFDRRGDKRGVDVQIKSASNFGGNNEVTLRGEEQIDGKVLPVECNIAQSVLVNQGLDVIGLIRLASDSQSNTVISCRGELSKYGPAVGVLRIEAQSITITSESK